MPDVWQVVHTTYALRGAENPMKGPEYSVRPVVRYVVAVYSHPEILPDGRPGAAGGSKVVGEFHNENMATDVRDALQKAVDTASARSSVENNENPT